MKWTFHGDAKNVVTEQSDNLENSRIERFIKSNPEDWLSVPGDNMDFWVNLSNVFCITKEESAQEDTPKNVEEAPIDITPKEACEPCQAQ